VALVPKSSVFKQRKKLHVRNVCHVTSYLTLFFYPTFNKAFTQVQIMSKGVQV